MEFDCQCVARTKARKRCMMGVVGSLGMWRRLVSRDGIIDIYDVNDIGELYVRRWLDQHCTLHDSPDVRDEVMPEWEAFDPAGAHKNLVNPLPEQWDIPTHGLGF